MEHIVKKAGYTLAQALDIFNRAKILTPFLVGYKDDNSEIKINSKDMILELSIPKIISSYKANSNALKSACIVFPADITNEDKKRVSTLIVMAQRYDTNEEVVISQPYKIVDYHMELLKFELYDYSPQVEIKLHSLEANFLQGILSYEGVENIWKQNFNVS